MKLFIDSCIYIGEKYEFTKHRNLERLARYAKNNGIELITTNLTKSEVQKHIISDVESAYKIFEKASKEVSKTIGYNNFIALNLQFQLDKSSLIEKIKDNFEAYVINNNFKVFDYSKVDIKTIMDKYFNIELPFEDKKSKKHEFPDAITINILENNIDLNKEKLIVITCDGGFSETFSNNNNVTVFQNINSYLNAINKSDHKELYLSIEAHYVDDKKLNEISNIIQEYLENNSNIEINGMECDRKGMCSGYEYDEIEIETVTVSDVKLSNIIEFITKESEKEVIVEFKANISVEANCDFFDGGSWDSEDKKYIIREYGSFYEKHENIVDVQFSIKYDHNKNEIIDATINEDFTLYLDVETVIDRKRLSNKVYY